MANSDIFAPEKKTFIDEDTGEKIEGYMNIRKVTRKNFDILYASALFDLQEDFGSKKLKVFNTILENRNSDNIVIMTQDKIAELAGVSRRTVIDTIKILERKHAIKKSSGIIFVNPAIINHYCTYDKEQWLMLKFEEFEEDKSIIRKKRKSIKKDIEKTLKFYDDEEKKAVGE